MRLHLIMSGLTVTGCSGMKYHLHRDWQFRNIKNSREIFGIFGASVYYFNDVKHIFQNPADCFIRHSGEIRNPAIPQTPDSGFLRYEDVA